MNRVLTTVLFEFPLPVLGMIAIAHAQFDPDAECRQWGGYGVLGTGLSTGLTHWNVSQDTVTLVDGSKEPCVRVTMRKEFHTGAPKPPVDFYLPLRDLREGVPAQLTMALPGKD